MVPYILGAVILLYMAFVIVKRVKAIKKGHYCSCGCDNCPTGCQAIKNKKKEI